MKNVCLIIDRLLQLLQTSLSTSLIPFSCSILNLHSLDLSFIFIFEERRIKKYFTLALVFLTFIFLPLIHPSRQFSLLPSLIVYFCFHYFSSFIQFSEQQHTSYSFPFSPSLTSITVSTLFFLYIFAAWGLITRPLAFFPSQMMIHQSSHSWSLISGKITKLAKTVVLMSKWM